MEHKCTLFSPDAVGREPLKLTLQTLFVPPGQDGERSLFYSRVQIARFVSLDTDDSRPFEDEVVTILFPVCLIR